MSKKNVLVVVGSLVIVGSVTLIAQERTAPVRTNAPARSVTPELDYAVYAGNASVSVSSAGKWTLGLPGLNTPYSFDAAVKWGRFPHDTAITGHAEVVVDRKEMWILLLVEEQEFHEVILRLGEDDARAAAAALTTAMEAVSLSDRVECQGSPGRCEGKCTVCCPKGMFPYCRCSGAGLCSCRPNSN